MWAHIASDFFYGIFTTHSFTFSSYQTTYIFFPIPYFMIFLITGLGTLPRNELLCQLFGGHRLQWISHKMNIRHPGGQWKKFESLGLFWSYQPNSTANLAHLPRNRAKWTGSSKTAPRSLIFSTAMGAKPSSYIKFIAT